MRLLDHPAPSPAHLNEKGYRAVNLGGRSVSFF